MRILIVEDEKKISDFLKVSLESECFIVDVADSKIYWIETFDGPDNQTINGFQITRYWADKVSVASPNGTNIIPKVRTRDVTGSQESFNIKHSESHAYLRDLIGQTLTTSLPNPPASGVTYCRH